MVYKNNFAIAIRESGKILREIDGTVRLPFGSEYQIRLKNLNSIRAKAKIEIDGEDVSGWLVIPANSHLDLERFVRDLNKGNRFKFIERTEEIENHRGINVEDGLVRVEYAFEKRYDNYCWNSPAAITNGSWFGQSSGLYQYTSPNTFNTSSQLTANSLRCSFVQSSATNDNGITVAGSESNQQFVTTSDFATEPSQVITLSLKGYCGNKKVTKPITVYHRPTCTTCGRKNFTTNKFCYNCGTALSII